MALYQVSWTFLMQYDVCGALGEDVFTWGSECRYDIGCAWGPTQAQPRKNKTTDSPSPT